KVPGVLKVTLFVSPGCKFLVLNALSIAVAECAVVPAFVQVTVAPTFTLTSFGVNSNSFIVTMAPPGAGDCATVTLPLVCKNRVTTSSSSPRHVEVCKVVSPFLRLQVRYNRLGQHMFLCMLNVSELFAQFKTTAAWRERGVTVYSAAWQAFCRG